MTDPFTRTIDIDYLAWTEKLKLSDAVELFVSSVIRERAKTQNIFSDTARKYREHFSEMIFQAVNGGQLTCEEIPGCFFYYDSGDVQGYDLSAAVSPKADLMSWARDNKIPVPEEMTTESLSDNPLKNELQKAEEELFDLTSKVSDIQQFVQKDEQEIVEVYELVIDGLDISKIDDPDLKAMGDDVTYPAVRLYAALYAGLLIGRHGREFTMDKLDSKLREIGFRSDLKLNGDDFKKIWDAIPKSLKNKGRQAKKPATNPS
jgi:hypothetical protein